MSIKDDFLNKIDDYKESIHAMAGFINFYRYDDSSGKMKDNILVFQGRQLTPSDEKNINSNGKSISYVAPDIGILLPSKTGVLGEIKKSFPKDQSYWLDDFKQLMSYDDDLTGWPTGDGKVTLHDIVLVLHITRVQAVIKFYNDKKDKEIKLTRPFIIIAFNRADERQQNYFFQKRLGSLTDKTIDTRLETGVSVPMHVFIETYSTIKIYDSKPPLPYLIELIWENVVIPIAANDAKFSRLYKNQKIAIELKIDDIINELHEGFSFHSLYNDASGRQPKIPEKEWIMDACEKLVTAKEAEWIDTQKIIRIYFRKYENILDHFIEVCSDEIQKEAQLSLPELNINKKNGAKKTNNNAYRNDKN
jgi:hypothetical protein